MKKKTLLSIVSGIAAVSVVCALVINPSSKGLVDDTAFRANADIAADTVIYLDDEAIALADTSGDNTSLRSECLQAYNLINGERESAGLPALSWSSNLESAADVRAKEISQSCSHTRPNGSPWYTVNSAIMGGENLAWGYNDAGSAVTAWMNSTTHRENILYPTFTQLAISLYVADDGTYYWSQEFGY